MVQGKINSGRHTDPPAGRHSIRTNQCPPSPSPIFTGQIPFLPPNQQCQSTEGNYSIVITQQLHFNGNATSSNNIRWTDGDGQHTLTSLTSTGNLRSSKSRESPSTKWISHDDLSVLSTIFCENENTPWQLTKYLHLLTGKIKFSETAVH